MARSEVNGPALEKQLERNPDVINALDKLGAAIAEDARVAAPKRTGRGAASITHELGYDEHGPRVRVSWGRKYFYMQFRELGTSHENAAPFLRPAAEKPRKI